MNNITQYKSHSNRIRILKRKNSNENSLFEIEKYFKNHYYSPPIKIKKRIKLDQFLIRNYSNYDINSPRKIESSLISLNPIIIDRIEKMIKFWEGVYKFSFQKIQDEKLKILKTNYNLKLSRTNFDKNYSYKLPHLNSNSSKCFTKRNVKITFNDTSINKNDRNVFNIFTKKFNNKIIL